MKTLVLIFTFMSIPAFSVMASNDCTDVVDVGRDTAAAIVKTSDGGTCVDSNGQPVNAVNGACPDGSSSQR